MIFNNSEFDFRTQKCTNIHSKIVFKMAWPTFAAKTLQDASKTLTRRPKRTPRRPQDAPRRPQDGPKTLPRRPQDGPRRPKTPQDSPRPLQDAPKPPKTTPRQRFWDDFKESLEDFWKIFWQKLPSDLPPRTYFPNK